MDFPNSSGLLSKPIVPSQCSVPYTPKPLSTVSRRELSNVYILHTASVTFLKGQVLRTKRRLELCSRARLCKSSMISRGRLNFYTMTACQVVKIEKNHRPMQLA